MSDLPPGWATTTLDQIADTKLGKMLSANARTGSAGRPYLRNKNVQWGRIGVDDVLRMDFSDDEFEKFRLREGDLLVCEGGEVGRAAIWRAPIAECAYQKALHRVRPRGGVLPEYILYLLIHYADTHLFEKFVTGSTIAHLPQEDLRRLPVPLPPVAEQRRIVAAIEEQVSRLEAAGSAMGNACRRVAALRSAILRCAFAGADGTCALGDLAEVVGGRTPKRLSASAEGTIPFYKVGDMNAASRSIMGAARTYLDDEAVARYGLRLWPPGTVIFPKQGGAIATNKKRVLAKAAACDLNTMGVLPGLDLRPRFLLLWLGTIDLAGLSDGSVVAQIKRGSVERLRIPRLSSDQQEKLADEVEHQLDTLESLATATNVAGRRARGLQAAILASAFRGDLVRQDPNEEPASVLLARIDAERGVGPTSARKRPEKAPA